MGSNLIGNSGVEAVLKAASNHPRLKLLGLEVKIK